MVLLLSIEDWPCEGVEEWVHDERLDAEEGLLQPAHHPFHPSLKVMLVRTEAHALMEKGFEMKEYFYETPFSLH